MTDIDNDDLENAVAYMNEEFKKLEAQVRAKMEQAKKLVLEAKALVDTGVDEHGFTGTNPFDYDEGAEGAEDLYLGCQEMRNATKPLLDAMGECGWSSSSQYC